MERWLGAAAHARTRPALYIGTAGVAHLEAIRNVLRVVDDGAAFGSPVDVSVMVSRDQWVVRCRGGLLEGSIDQSIRWSNYTLLTDALEDARDRSRSSGSPTDSVARVFAGPSPPSFARAVAPAYLARFYLIAIRTVAGFWCQAFSDGAPVDALECANALGEWNFVVAGVLTPEWFTGLPYTLAAVRGSVGARVGRSEVSWVGSIAFPDPRLGSAKCLSAISEL
jgi:hypothetical protein